MKAQDIYFERTKSLPGYNNIKVGIQIQIQDGDRVMDVLRKAELFVAKALNDSPTQQQMQESFQNEIDNLPF